MAFQKHFSTNNISLIPPIRNVKGIKNKDYKNQVEHSEACSQFLFPHCDIMVLMSFCLKILQILKSDFLVLLLYVFYMKHLAWGSYFPPFFLPQESNKHPSFENLLF